MKGLEPHEKRANRHTHRDYATFLHARQATCRTKKRSAFWNNSLWLGAADKLHMGDSNRAELEDSEDWPRPDSSGASLCSSPNEPVTDRGSVRRATKKASRKRLSRKHLREAISKKRRARDSNPQPIAGHLNSSQAPHHSVTLRDLKLILGHLSLLERPNTPQIFVRTHFCTPVAGRIGRFRILRPLSPVECGR